MLTSQNLMIGPQYVGPPDLGNGGYVVGLMAAALCEGSPVGQGAIEVTLKGPLPLSRSMQLRFDEDGVDLWCGDDVLATGFPYDVKAGLQHSDPKANGRCVALRTREWTYIYRVYESDELYDRKGDPLEEVNLINSAEHQDLGRDLKERILAWLVETSDVIPWEKDPRF